VLQTNAQLSRETSVRWFSAVCEEAESLSYHLLLYVAVFPLNLSLHVLKLTSHTVCVSVCERKRKKSAFTCFCLGCTCLHVHVFVFAFCLSVCLCVCVPTHQHSTPPTTGRVGERGERWTTERLTSWHHKLWNDWLLLEAVGFISQPGASLSTAASLGSEQHSRKTQEIN